MKLHRGALAALLLAVASVAHADVEPPHARDVSVEYPSGAHGDAFVVLELVVGDDGHVIDARVVAGAEPFLSAALGAAKAFTFDPAKRDGKASAARIRIEIPFHDAVVVPPPRVETIEVTPPLPKPPPPKKPITLVEDVHVRGTRKEVGGTSMSKEDVRDMPGAFGDAFRAIDMMPGVVPIVSGLPFFFVRGAPPGNTGYFIDSVRVPLLYHLALGPSVIHPALIDRADFYPGGYPAPFGRFTGGIVAGQTTPPTSSIRAEGELRLFDVGVLGEAPFAGGKGDALVAGRYGYPALLVPLFAPNTNIAYWDYQARASYRVTPRDTLTAFVFGSFDELDSRDPTSYDQSGNPLTYGPFYPLFRTEFHRADLRWDRAISGGNVRTALTLGIDSSLEGNAGSGVSVLAESLQLRTELDKRVSKTLRARAGADVLLYHYTYTQNDTIDGIPFSTTLPVRNDVVFGMYADVVWNVHPRVEIVPGLRLDAFTSRASGNVDPQSGVGVVTGFKASAAIGVDPRIASRVTIGKRLTWVSTFGITHQPPSLGPIPGGELGNLQNGLQSAVQASQGFEAKLPLDLDLRGTFFIQHYFNMSDALTTCSSILSGFDLDTKCIDARTEGRSMGLEVLLRRSFSKRIAGWASYTFSRSTVTVSHPKFGEPSEVPSNFDRPHVLNLALAFDFGKGWHAGTRFTYYTGLPYTQTQSGVPVPPYNGLRLPDFWRFDLRLEKRWRLGKRGQFAIVLEGLNITFNKEAIGINCTTTDRGFGTPDVCKPQLIGPVSVPSLGIEARY